MIHRRIAILLMLAGACSGAVAHEAKVNDLEIVHPNVTEPADASVKDVTVLMTILNQGKSPDKLLSASSPVASSAKIHGGSTSSPSQSIDLPPGGRVAFSRQGPRVELKGLNERLTGYEMFPLSLTFEKAGKVEIQVMVEANEDAMTGSEMTGSERRN